jgi:outer membrane lipoprotein carrier protein
MKQFPGIIALVVLLLPLHTTALAQGPARIQLNAFSQGLDALHARFSQVVISPDSKVQDSSEGQVWLSRPQRFRWEYGGDYPELVVADGDRIWIYDEMLEQVTVKDQALAAVDSPLVLLTEPGRLEQQFEVREAGEIDGAQLLELSAISAEYQFERILLGLKDKQLVLMIMEDAFGLRTELRFDDVRRNPDLDEALFRFEPPEGTDVIGDLSGAANQR